MKIFLAKANSRNYSFEAVGQTYNEPIGSLRKGLKQHAKTHNLAPFWFDEWADIRVDELVMGQCYRDHELMK